MGAAVRICTHVGRAFSRSKSAAQPSLDRVFCSAFDLRATQPLSQQRTMYLSRHSYVGPMPLPSLSEWLTLWYDIFIGCLSPTYTGLGRCNPIGATRG